MKIDMVVNRGNCSVSYNLPDLMVNRFFRAHGNSGDRMEIDPEELKALSYTQGGKILLESYLMIENEEACSDLGIVTEPEYFYTSEEIHELLINGTENQLLDCLQFAPAGVLDLLKSIAVEIRLDSTSKRNLISEHLHVNLDAMIKNDIVVKAAESLGVKEDGEAVATQRRSTPIKKADKK